MLGLVRPCGLSHKPLLTHKASSCTHLILSYASVPLHGARTSGVKPIQRRSWCKAATASASTASTPSPNHGQRIRLPDLKKLLAWWNIQSPQTQDEDNSHGSLKPLLHKIWTLCSPDKWLLCGATIFMVSAALAELAIPHFATKSIFAAGAQGATSDSFGRYLQLLGGLVLAFGVNSALRGYCFSLLNNRMTMRLRSQLFKAMVQSEAAFFDANEVGALTSRLQTDCQAITRCVATNLNIALRNALQAFGGFIYLWLLSKELCTATLAITSVLWAVTLVYGNFARRTQKVYQDVLACGNKVADEVLSLSRIVRSYSTEAQEARRYDSWLGWLYQVALRQASGYSLFIVTSHIACYASKVVALALGCTRVIQGDLTPEQLTNFIIYVEFVVYSSLNVCDEYTEFMEAVGASERVVTLLDSKPAPQIAPGIKLATFTGGVILKDVVFRYPSRPGNIALDGVSIALPPGKRIALVGRSGSGKSSVVSLLQRLYDPNEGSVQVEGVDLREIDADWYRSHIGVVSQDTRLFGASVAANIAYGFSEQKLLETYRDSDGNSDASSPPALTSGVDEEDKAPGVVGSGHSAGMKEGPETADPLVQQLGYGNGAAPPAPVVSASTGSGGSASAGIDGSSSADTSTVGGSSRLESGTWLEPSSDFPMVASQLPVSATQEQIEEAAREANAHDFIAALPLGYDTPVNDKLLSGGQRQRIALARALIRKPNILILDEATSALDAESEAQVQVALDKAMRVQGRTVVVIAHRLSTVRNADIIYVMDKGKVAEVGDHTSLMAARGVYWQLVVRQEYGASSHQDTAKDGRPEGAALTGSSAAARKDVTAAATAADKTITAAAAAAAGVGVGVGVSEQLTGRGFRSHLDLQEQQQGVANSMVAASIATAAHGGTDSDLEMDGNVIILDAESTLAAPEPLILDMGGLSEARSDNGTENSDHGIGTSLDSEDLSAALGASNMQ